jgi:hypothetical protein
MRELKICLLFIILTTSCQNNDINEKNQEILNSLKRENDSLKLIMEEISQKYVFDSIIFRDVRSPDNTYKLNSDFEVELLVLGYNSKESYFVKYDDLKNTNPDTINVNNGGFVYRTKLDEKVNPIIIEMNLENKYGKRKQAILYDEITVKN